VTEKQLLDLATHRESDAFDDLEKAVLDYAVALTRTPADASDALVERLRRDLTDEQLVELTAAIAWENYRARFNHAFGATDEGFSDQPVCLLPRLET
jgi:alkylhydroperoxidase family enzyme